jgi:hypothetical protein
VQSQELYQGKWVTVSHHNLSLCPTQQGVIWRNTQLLTSPSGEKEQSRTHVLLTFPTFWLSGGLFKRLVSVLPELRGKAFSLNVKLRTAENKGEWDMSWPREVLKTDMRERKRLWTLEVTRANLFNFYIHKHKKNPHSQKKAWEVSHNI